MMYSDICSYLICIFNIWVMCETLSCPINVYWITKYTEERLFFRLTLNYFFNYFIVVQLQLPALSPHLSPPLHPNPPPSLASTLPLGFVHVSFIVVPEKLSLHCPIPPSPLAIVRLFLTSMSLVIFCLLFFSFSDYVPVKGEIIWYLSLTTWLISLSTMFSSSIHAVTKYGSSFFLSVE